MQLTGVTINIMTLGGLAVAVGRVVDDAIVVLENIYRHRALGEDRLTASINGPREVAGAITASTLTTVAVFLPLGFVGGLVSPVLPAVRADRDVRAARLARLRADRRPGPGLLPHPTTSSPTSTRTASRPRSIWVRALHPDHHVRPARPADQARRRRASRPSCSSPRRRSRRCCRPSSSTPAPRRPCIVTIAPPTGASSAAVLEQTIAGRDDPPRRPRRSSSSRRASRPRATRARRSSSPPSRAGPPTARR